MNNQSAGSFNTDDIDEMIEDVQSENEEEETDDDLCSDIDKGICHPGIDEGTE